MFVNYSDLIESDKIKNCIKNKIQDEGPPPL